MNPYYTLYNRINHFHLLKLAERLINDNAPTVAMFTDPYYELVNRKKNGL